MAININGLKYKYIKPLTWIKIYRKHSDVDPLTFLFIRKKDEYKHEELYEVLMYNKNGPARKSVMSQSKWDFSEYYKIITSYAKVNDPKWNLFAREAIVRIFI